jgi:hypothetical protein
MTDIIIKKKNIKIKNKVALKVQVMFLNLKKIKIYIKINQIKRTKLIQIKKSKLIQTK